eukprot:CAMPEP_0198326494 /NCGR_PEP_ID=MMETSP1450-20131203/14010_1 /TAXON_ID=753684 ORGANISM="Madagascaria erythrocladiodes, Strain CCMP3234" /NCGR_SAMPLE_ID=MMETSP1450 /ASSEMBLY_ACC=CAM_ASM_001115 /LENGTH=324 /DNA_ID=CAMNT_0044030459 /DNA_START=1 /DNA_END=977 /DNA_ORIENTATION=-
MLLTGVVNYASSTMWKRNQKLRMRLSFSFEDEDLVSQLRQKYLQAMLDAAAQLCVHFRFSHHESPDGLRSRPHNALEGHESIEAAFGGREDAPPVPNSPLGGNMRQSDEGIASFRTAPKRHICVFCGAGFGKRYNLKRHTSTIHEDKRAFRCTKCGLVFSQLANLRRHVATIHDKARPLLVRNANIRSARYQIFGGMKLQNISDEQNFVAMIMQRHSRLKDSGQPLVPIETSCGKQRRILIVPPAGPKLCSQRFTELRAFESKNDVPKATKQQGYSEENKYGCSPAHFKIQECFCRLLRRGAIKLVVHQTIESVEDETSPANPA